ncbi:SPOR domain-containing protein [Chromohalobacter sp. TMW 2.2308]|uniref:SPOR domain-containing protein n=1 Tax=Chromohalobacter TaxID=42054 RepID=UPI001FFC39F1|nr:MULTISPECIES: SPOR domain-containing protein [Chromohalobacter]MCK2041801.1 SPOR domain-containing protein [Chromohalobacter moromii]MCT8513949.1 SPOR domain-containing protein [Chromohalobacter sp. TMW 2.2271]
MKYGIRERVSGAIILVALAVIFLPMLLDEPTPRSERPEPVLAIEQPISVDQRDVDSPEPPANLEEDADNDRVVEPSTEAQLGQSDADAASQPASSQPAGSDDGEASDEADSVNDDPIAAIAEQSASSEAQGDTGESPTTSEVQDGWAVQVGSFGQPDNAKRLVEKLSSQGFDAYQRPRDNDLTTVYVGPFGTSDEGERVRTELKEDANIQGLLIRVREE